MSVATQSTPTPACLKVATDPRWLDVAVAATDRLLADHAHCEKKAAASAMSLIAKYPDDSHLVTCMLHLAQEELDHFGRVHALLVKRGAPLGRIDQDDYVRELLGLNRTGEPEHMIDRLLILSLVEARSCERFVMLSEHHPDPELRAFYRELAFSEAGHHQLFVALAGRHAPKESVTERLEELCHHEAAIVRRIPVAPRMH